MMQQNSNHKQQFQNQQDQTEGSSPDIKEMENQDISEINLNETPDVMQEKLKDEEFSAEFTADDSLMTKDGKENSNTETNSIMGWIAVALSILSLFMMPIFLGGAGIIVGFIARNRNAEWLGNTAIIIGAISILVSFFSLTFR